MVVVSAATVCGVKLGRTLACGFDKSLGPIAADKPSLYREPGPASSLVGLPQSV